jgi:hypothetical protein
MAGSSSTSGGGPAGGPNQAPAPAPSKVKKLGGGALQVAGWTLGKTYNIIATPTAAVVKAWPLTSIGLGVYLAYCIAPGYVGSAASWIGDKIQNDAKLSEIKDQIKAAAIEGAADWLIANGYAEDGREIDKAVTMILKQAGLAEDSFLHNQVKGILTERIKEKLKDVAAGSPGVTGIPVSGPGSLEDVLGTAQPQESQEATPLTRLQKLERELGRRNHIADGIKVADLDDDDAETEEIADMEQEELEDAFIAGHQEKQAQQNKAEAQAAAVQARAEKAKEATQLQEAVQGMVNAITNSGRTYEQMVDDLREILVENDLMSAGELNKLAEKMDFSERLGKAIAGEVRRESSDVRLQWRKAGLVAMVANKLKADVNVWAAANNPDASKILGNADFISVMDANHFSLAP